MRSLGYTLVELLVVMAIMVIVGVFAFANFRDFSEDQAVNQDFLQLQSFLRIAQSNATSATVCKDDGVVSWAVKFTEEKSKVLLVCGPEDKLVQMLELVKTQIAGIKCNDTAGVNINPPLKISYAPLSGNVTFSGSEDALCVKTALQLVISLENAVKPGGIKSFYVSKGGVIQDVP